MKGRQFGTVNKVRGLNDILEEAYCGAFDA